MMSNKGSVLDLFVIIAVLFGTAIAIIVGYKIISSIQSTWVPDDATALAILTDGTAVMKVFNAGFLIITFGMGVAVFISAFMIKTYPTFFVVSILMLGIALIVAAPFSNAFNYFINTDEMVDAIPHFGILNTIMRNLPKIIFGFGLLLIVVLYAKTQTI